MQKGVSEAKGETNNQRTSKGFPFTEDLDLCCEGKRAKEMLDLEEKDARYASHSCEKGSEEGEVGYRFDGGRRPGVDDGGCCNG